MIKKIRDWRQKSEKIPPSRSWPVLRESFWKRKSSSRPCTWKKSVTHCALSGDLASKVTKLAGTLFVCRRFSTFWVEDRISYRYDSPRESRRKPEKSNKLPLCLFCRWKMLSAFVCIWKCTFHQCQNNLVIACGTEELQLQRHGTQLIDCWTKFQERGSLETKC